MESPQPSGGPQGPMDPGFMKKLAKLEKECAWVYRIKKAIGRESYTEKAFGLYHYFLTGNGGAWRDFVASHAKVDPAQLDSFTSQLANGLKLESMERVAIMCRWIYESPLIEATRLRPVPRGYVAEPVADILEGRIDDEDEKTVKLLLDFSRLYEVLYNEIMELALAAGIPKEKTEELFMCLMGCPEYKEERRIPWWLLQRQSRGKARSTRGSRPAPWP